MCGICGEWNLLGADPAALERMNAALLHRGPDDHGAVLLGEAGLAMRRLSIIDLARGHQPIANEDGTRLDRLQRRDLQPPRAAARRCCGAGHDFRTDSDTEVILHLYEERGEHCVDELRGMFAFAIWDTPPAQAAARPRPLRPEAAVLPLRRPARSSSPPRSRPSSPRRQTPARRSSTCARSTST